LSNEILSWMNVLLRLEITREELYVLGISRKICDILFVKECCSVQTCTQEVKPFVEAYVLTMTSSCTTFESDWAQTKYSNHYELYKIFKQIKGFILSVVNFFYRDNLLLTVLSQILENGKNVS